jgi:hypothetical protein
VVSRTALLVVVILLAFGAVLPLYFGYDSLGVVFSKTSQHAIFRFSVPAAKNTTLAQELPGNITGYFFFDMNPGGVSVGNPVMMHVEVQLPGELPTKDFPANLSFMSNAFFPKDAIPASGTPNANQNFVTIQLTSSDGIIFTGQAEVVSYYSGLWGGTIDFNPSGSGVGVPNVIQIQPEESTYTFASGAILISLEILIAALIVVEIRHDIGNPRTTIARAIATIATPTAKWTVSGSITIGRNSWMGNPTKSNCSLG